MAWNVGTKFDFYEFYDSFVSVLKLESSSPQSL